METVVDMSKISEISDSGIMIMFYSRFPQDNTQLENFLKSDKCFRQGCESTGTNPNISLMNYAAIGKNIEIIKLVRNICTNMSTEIFYQIMISNNVPNDILIQILKFEHIHNIYRFFNYCDDKKYKISDTVGDYILDRIEKSSCPTNCYFLSKFFDHPFFTNKNHPDLIKKITAHGIDISDSLKNNYFINFTKEEYVCRFSYEIYQQMFETLLKSDVYFCYDTIPKIKQQNRKENMITVDYIEAIGTNKYNKYDIMLYLYELIFNYYDDNEDKIKILGKKIIEEYCPPNVSHSVFITTHLKILARYKIIILSDYFITNDEKKREKYENIFYLKLRSLSACTIFEIISYCQTKLEKEVTKLKTELQLIPESSYVQSLAADFKEKQTHLVLFKK